MSDDSTNGSPNGSTNSPKTPNPLRGSPNPLRGSPNNSCNTTPRLRINTRLRTPFWIREERDRVQKEKDLAKERSRLRSKEKKEERAEEKKGYFRSCCCNSKTDKNLLRFIVQASLSLCSISLCMTKLMILTSNEEASLYIGLLTGTLGLWMPSPL